MNKYIIALTTPDGQTIVAPGKIPTGGQDALEVALRGAVILFLLIVVITSLIYLIWGGIDWILSGGEKEGIAKARAKITYAIIGLVVSFSSFFIINIIGSFFGISLLANN